MVHHGDSKSMLEVINPGNIYILETRVNRGLKFPNPAIVSIDILHSVLPLMQSMQNQLFSKFQSLHLGALKFCLHDIS